MTYAIHLDQARPGVIAAVRANTTIADIPTAFKPALDQVWAFLRNHKDLKPGKNLFLYHHPRDGGSVMDVDFGVEVPDSFTGEGNVHCVDMPVGDIVRTIHVGPYDRLKAAHMAIHAWCGINGRKIGGYSWEVYGDWCDDAEKLETTVVYLLRD